MLTEIVKIKTFPTRAKRNFAQYRISWAMVVVTFSIIYLFGDLQQIFRVFYEIGIRIAKTRLHEDGCPVELYRPCRCSKSGTVGRPYAAGARRSDATPCRWTTSSAPAKTTSSWAVWTASLECTAYTRTRRPICATRRPTCWSSHKRKVQFCRRAPANWSGMYPLY